MVKDFAANRLLPGNRGAALRSLAAVAGTLATFAAVIVGAVLALFAAATVTVIALMTSALLGFAALAMRARRTVRRRHDDSVIEARHLGGHHWVATGWSERG
jgi:hypothetical protein